MYAVVMIIPPEPILSELEELMKELNSFFNTSKALDYKPHITLKSLGKINESELEKIKQELEHVARTTKPFLIELENLRFYGSREDIPGIYISINKSEKLLELHKKLVLSLKKYSDRKDRSYKEMGNYFPHLTLVADDIKPEDLERAKRMKINYPKKFETSSISLFLKEQNSYFNFNF